VGLFVRRCDLRGDVGGRDAATGLAPVTDVFPADEELRGRGSSVSGFRSGIWMSVLVVMTIML
jgi:hypothetical protein